MPVRSRFSVRTADFNFRMASEITLLSDDDVDRTAAFDITGTHDLYDPRFGSAGSVELECLVCGMRSDVCLGHHASLSLGTHMFHPLIYKRAEEALNNTCFGCSRPLPAIVARTTSARTSSIASSSSLSEAIELTRRASIGSPPRVFRRPSSLSEAIERASIGSPPRAFRRPSSPDVAEQQPKILKKRSRKCHHCGSYSYGGYTINATNLEYAVKKNSEAPLWAHEVPEGVLPKGYVVSKILVPPIHFRNTEDMEWASDIHKMYEQLTYLIANNKHERFRPKPQKCSPEEKERKYMTVAAMYTKIVGAMKKEGVIGIMSGKDGIFRKLMLGKRVESCARAVIVGDPSLELDQIAVPASISDSIRINVYCTKFNVTSMKQMAEKSALWWDETEDLVDVAHVVPGMVYQRHLQDGDLMLFNRQPSLSRHSMMCFRTKIRKDKYSVFGMNPQVTAPFNADFDGDEMNAFFMENRAEMLELCHLSECVVDRDHNKTIVVPVQDVVTGCYIMSLHDEPVSDEVWADCVLSSGADYADLESKTTRSLLYTCIPGYDGRVLKKKQLTEYVRDIGGQQALDVLQRLQSVVQRWLSHRGLTVSLRSVVAAPISKGNDEDPDAFRDRCHLHVEEQLSGTDIMHVIQSGAKGSVTHASHMAVAIGQQYIRGRKGMFCDRSYSQGLNPDEFYGHQMAAREGVVSTGVGTASTGYLNRRSCKILADLKMQYNGTVADDFGLSTF